MVQVEVMLCYAQSKNLIGISRRTSQFPKRLSLRDIDLAVDALLYALQQAVIMLINDVSVIKSLH